MTSLLLVIGSLSFGAIRRLFMVCPPLKCTCTPNLLHVFFILSLRPWWYGTTMYRLLWLLFWPVCVLLVLLVLGFWLFILALLMAQVGYLHLVRALKRCSSSFCNSWGEQVVFALWNRVPATLYFDGMVWWLSYWRYKSVWVFFLNTDVLRLPSSSGVMRMFRTGIDPSSLVSSQVNVMLGCMELRCSRKLSLLFFLMMVNVSSTYLFHKVVVLGMSWWPGFQIPPCIN